jgi:hypothetical protein
VLRRVEPSWDASKPSILDHVRAHLPDEDADGLLGGGDQLPDEDDLKGSLRWIPGAMDGIGTHHLGVGDSEQTVDDVLRLVVDRYGASAADRRAHDAYRPLAPGDAL